ncbi:carbon-nitrogen hydrolase [Corynascus novoguineensis]|uniref:Carbon-nitrogen hydrolase n=1 Tax=Corynascus novoguineensis TaxID=1126955 RepID=A0AAN7CW18_9PEZI|nr:carbon-nitrogen hydrolase [Corynascus novoguineensis]
MAPKTIRLGTASPATQATTAQTLAKLETIARQAASKDIDILLLPEAFIGGYPRGTYFGCVIGSRSQEGREEYLRYFQNAVDLGDTVGDGAGAGQAWVKRELPSDAVPGYIGDSNVPNKRGDGTREELERIARETQVFLITGLIEKAGGSMYCSVVYVCPKLGIIGKRRKVMPTGTERLVWAQGSPATLRAVSTTIRGIRVNLAAAICWENYMPLVRQAIYAQNVNLYLAPTADGREAWLSLLRTTAIEGRCFVISSNMCVRDTPTTNGDTTTASIHRTGETNGAPRDISPLTQANTHLRRRSGATEDGNDIALPCSPPPGLASRSRGRRQSIFDEDGNEIVLPCSPPLRTASRPRGRRQSVFDEDGNEIVLCAHENGEKKSSATKYPVATAPAPPGVGLTTTTIPAAAPLTTTARKQVPKVGGGFTSRGGSAIVSPFGDVLAGPQWEDDEGIIYADVDFDECIRGRLDLDTAGSYSRNDSFKLEVRGLDLSPLPY